MSRTPRHTILFVLAMFLLAPVAVAAQQKKTSNPQHSTLKEPNATTTPAKLPLQSLTLVSTSEAARKVAEEASTKAETSKKGAASSNLSKSGQEAEGAVLEFKPADTSSLAGSTAGAFKAKGRSKSLLKNIHGSAYGAAASAIGQANGESAAVGADSGNGKFSIYVQGEHTHASTPAPH